jgi:hypothetical protein
MHQGERQFVQTASETQPEYWYAGTAQCAGTRTSVLANRGHHNWSFGNGSRKSYALLVDGFSCYIADGSPLFWFRLLEAGGTQRPVPV